MALHRTHKTQILGRKGELLFELAALSRGIFCQKMTGEFDYDYTTSTGKRVEVKTSNICIGKKKHKDKIYLSERWQFGNYEQQSMQEGHKRGSRIARDRDCDFYALLGFTENENVYRLWIIPAALIGKRMVINISKNSTEFDGYRNGWSQLE